MSEGEDHLKLAAAELAAAQVNGRDDRGFGIGLDRRARREGPGGGEVGDGLRIVGIPTSEATAAQARRLGIPLTTLADVSQIDMTIDGADEVEEGSLNLIKGLGEALLREQIIANASKRFVIVVDERKLVPQLGDHDPVPVEVVPFGWQATARRLLDPGGKPVLRRNPPKSLGI